VSFVRAVEKFAAAGPHPPLHDRIHAWHAYASEHDVDSGVGEGPYPPSLKVFSAAGSRTSA
jgi:hypothetical protein